MKVQIGDTVEYRPLFGGFRASAKVVGTYPDGMTALIQYSRGTKRVPTNQLFPLERYWTCNKCGVGNCRLSGDERPDYCPQGKEPNYQEN